MLDNIQAIDKLPITKSFSHGYFIPKKDNCQRWVIPDIHGHFYSFTELVDKIGFSKNDQLFLLGDLINRGKYGQEVLDFIIDLIDLGYAVFPLRGNHEEMLLNSHYKNYGDEAVRVPTLKVSKGIRDKNHRILYKYLLLLEMLPYFYELDNFFLVHAGFDFNSNRPFSDYTNMTIIRNFEVDSIKAFGKTIIHGHNKMPLSRIKNNIANRNSVICLENGLSVKNNPEFGNLLCLNIDTYELLIQPNID